MRTLGALLAAICVKIVASDVVLTKKIMELSLTAAELSALAYAEKAPNDTLTADYESFGYYDEEPDQALTAKTHDGYCYVAFRGTSLTWDDWAQNLDMGKHQICIELAGGKEEKCCTSRNGFYQAYNTGYRDEVEQAVRDCAKTCEDKDECVVITGHSQGGAIASVASLYLADLNPYVITFGQPATLEAPCDLVTSERVYRFVNTKETESVGIAYDPVPMAPGLGADHFGNMIVLSADTSGVAFIGLDAQDYLHPYSVGVEAHYMVNGSTPFAGYEDRLKGLMANATYPIRNNGYVPGSLCSEDKECETNECAAETAFTFNRCVGTMCDEDDDCTTQRCDSGVCLSKAGSCMPCDEDSDCAGDGKCLFFLCTNEKGKMDNNCFCRSGGDCDSGRCEGYVHPQCEARLSLGGSCNENSDCKSNYCGWDFVCEEPLGKNGGIGVVAWILIALVFLGGVFLTYRFVKQRRTGYQQIPESMDV